MNHGHALRHELGDLLVVRGKLKRYRGCVSGGYGSQVVSQAAPAVRCQFIDGLYTCGISQSVNTEWRTRFGGTLSLKVAGEVEGGFATSLAFAAHLKG